MHCIMRNADKLVNPLFDASQQPTEPAPLQQSKMFSGSLQCKARKAKHIGAPSPSWTVMMQTVAYQICLASLPKTD